MLYSQLFGKTVKEISQDIKLISHKLLYQGGFIRESTAGRYYFLPLGIRVQDKIIKIIEKEMDKTGAQKLITPVLHPLELWEESNRTNSVGFELMTIKDQRGAAFALGGTAEEMMVDLVRKFNLSYKDLPFNIYQFSQKFRDERRARGGLLRVREFLMKDAYSFHQDEENFKIEYRRMWETYLQIFKQVGLEVIPIESDNGYIGGEYCHEFVVESPAGESRFLISPDRTYAAHEEVAIFKREIMNENEIPLPLKTVDAPRGPSIQAGVDLYQKPAWRQIKTIVYVTDEKEKILVAIRGDLEINEIKLKKVLKCIQLRTATEEEIRALGSVVGFVSPLKIKAKKIGDPSLKTVTNFYTGADEFQKDTLNVNYERDFTVDLMADIALPPKECVTNDNKKLIESKGIEVGNIFQLGTHYSTKMERANFTDENGHPKPYYMGCYGIGVGRTMATVIEIHHDEKGIIWPKNIAPYQVHLINLGGEENLIKKAKNLYLKMQNTGIEVLWDDRDLRAGEKLNDADLIGIPIRLIISNRSLEKGGVEWKERANPENKLIPENQLLSELAQYYAT
ncbi:MAG: prolyl-tRNA synthetase, prolyl-tRNA synthetase [Candidatus Peregrinibacteria bacterium GW2011_GWE2_39_6]|nr:MAG: prolyl-tRNA synthetase, prolyl-tRNA synthetase [Candidatus Peregrinibacteria bacterium GW2011_GWF2_39_17]KKR26695.1 MAG: prolyl-tRNA synthetase, prolyl-tRNA synthetase [Candidatus Peregrinibacteria bacterium GW2011_GWE2_39_6]HCW32940.1 proline--tRNA ligase [Candidatus Peregrinibacteria bacterium]